MSDGTPEYHDSDGDLSDLEGELAKAEGHANGLAEHLLRMGASKATFPVKVGDECFTVTIVHHG